MNKTNNHSFRLQQPVRSQNVQEQRRYQSYKSQLRKDFNSKCGYCDDHDKFCGGMRGYHIDHFAPKSKFPEWKNSYQNLVYSCPYCNGAKSNKWLGDKIFPSHNGNEGFIDPCDQEYDQHLFRDFRGHISGHDCLGEYMVQNLRLYLLRHVWTWQVEELSRIRDGIDALIPYTSGSKRKELLEEFRHLTHLIDDYRNRVNES